jgi:putative transposase
MKKALKYRLYTNKLTLYKASYWIDLCRLLYNAALEQRICAYKRSRKTVTYNEQQNNLTELRAEYIEYANISVQVERDVLRKLDYAYKSFFRRVKNGKDKAGFPRFKGNNRYNSFTLHGQSWKLNGKYLTIRNLGKFKLSLSRQIQGEIKAITIKRSTTNKWYAYFVCEDVPKKEYPQTDKVIGIDVGIKSYLTDSEGNKVVNPKFLKNAFRELRIKNRKLARAKKGSNRRKETKLQVSECYEKITNQRHDFLHKLSTEYIKNYDVIKVENLNIQGMSRNKKLSRDINDCSWGTFFNYLSYKAEDAGRTLIKVNPRNTSKKCNKCGSINHELKLSDRVWICENCGTTHDRDENAAINISEAWAKPSNANVRQKFVRSSSIIETCNEIPA